MKNTTKTINKDLNNMDFWEDIMLERSRIEKSIKKYGYAPEHNFEWYQCQPEDGDKNVFVEFEDNTSLLTTETPGKKECVVFSSPVAPKEKRAEILIKYLNLVFQSEKFVKVELELEDDLYKKFINELPNTIKAKRIEYTLTWPIYILYQFDENLSGKKWNSLRKTRNKFYKEHLVETFDAKKYLNKQELHQVIDDWKKNRGADDKAYSQEYHNLIDSNFAAATEARALLVDGKVCGINAGWMIPNSNRYYGSIGIHNYNFSGLGDVLYMEDLIYLKKQGYTEADMGGGEEELTAFKSKSHPQSFYKTHIFTVIKS